MTSSRDRLEIALARIADPNGEGARTCLTVYTEPARAAAEAADKRKAAGQSRGPLDGAIVSIKDLFDVASEPTRAGSTIFANAPPAKADAPVVKRLRDAGAVIVAKTNMTEFAFSGLGLNPHFGTPANPFDKGRVPGGSSSGAGASVAYEFCEIAIGTDTGGSTRAPAAFCGCVGYKPSKQRIPTAGAFPLSQTQDSIGPLAKTVAACAAADAVLAGEAPRALEAVDLGAVRLGLAQGAPLDNLDVLVSAQFSEGLARLKRSGAKLSDEAVTAELEGMSRVGAGGTIIGIEAFHTHRDLLVKHAAAYDPFVRARIESAAHVSDADYARKLSERAALVKAMDARLADLDALIMPTTPIVAPLVSDVATIENWNAQNGRVLRNTPLVNFFDLCAISLPLPRHYGDLSTGLMLVARNGQDRKLFQIAAAVERLLRD